MQAFNAASFAPAKSIGKVDEQTFSKAWHSLRHRKWRKENEKKNGKNNINVSTANDEFSSDVWLVKFG